VTSLHRAWIPGMWDMLYPTPVDIGIFIGSLGIFTTLFLLFMRYLPVFALAELKAVLPQADPHLPGEHGPHTGAGHLPGHYQAPSASGEGGY
jgi:molybdopterin-containing oxidoreductase family membrane subunit